MKIDCQIVTPTRVVLQQSCDELYAPGQEGEFGVLSDHAPMVGMLSAGPVRVRDGASTSILAVRGGFFQVLQNHVTLLADEAIKIEEIDVAARKNEQAQLEKALLDPDLELAVRKETLKTIEWIQLLINLQA